MEINEGIKKFRFYMESEAFRKDPFSEKRDIQINHRVIGLVKNNEFLKIAHNCSYFSNINFIP